MVSPPDDLGGLRADAVQGLERSRLSSDRGGLELSHLSEAVGTPQLCVEGGLFPLAAGAQQEGEGHRSTPSS